MSAPPVSPRQARINRLLVGESFRFSDEIDSAKLLNKTPRASITLTLETVEALEILPDKYAKAVLKEIHAALSSQLELYYRYGEENGRLELIKSLHELLRIEKPTPPAYRPR